MNQDILAAGEAIELSQLLSFKGLCLTKAATMQVLVTDPQLQTIMQDDVQKTTVAMNDLRNLLANSKVYV